MRRSHSAGFTLMESVVMIFILAFLLIALFSMYEWHGKVYQFQRAVVAVTEQARFSTQAMQDFVSQGNRVLASANINSQVYTSSTTTLVVKLPSADKSGNIIPSTWDLGVFYLNGNKLFYLMSPGAGSGRAGGLKLLSDRVTKLEFIYDYSDWNLVKKVEIDFTLTDYAREQAVVKRIKENFYLKNY